MKYLAVLILLVVIVRIDFFMRLFDQAVDKYQAKTEVDTKDLTSSSLVPFKDDRSIQQTPREIFLVLLQDFQTSPTASNRDRAMQFFKANPTIFKQTLDLELEQTIFRWRDLLILNNPEAGKFLLDLHKVLVGENLLMLKRFFALWIDINMASFLAAYSETPDTACAIITTFGDNIPEDEKVNEYFERTLTLKEFLAKEKTDPKQKALALNCQSILTAELTRLNFKNPEAAPPEEAPMVEPEFVPMENVP